MHTHILKAKRKRLVLLPRTDEVYEVLPALADFAEFVLYFGGFALMASPHQTLPHLLQLLLILLCHC